MGNSASRTYVAWYNRCSSGDWATWEPGDQVSPGDVGRFNKELRFRHWQALSDYGINFTVSDEQPVGARMYATGKDFNVQAKLAGQSATGFANLGSLDAGLKITAKKERACLLQIREATESHIIQTKLLLEELAALVRAGVWELDLLVVFERTRASRGFAAISQGGGQSLELKAAADVQFSEDLELGGAELSLASGKISSDFLVYEFSELETPIFGPPIRVRHDLWDRLLPWRSEGPYLIDPTGGRHDVQSLPIDLSNVAERDRRYDPGRSAMKPNVLAAIKASVMFEEVRSLPLIELQKTPPPSNIPPLGTPGGAYMNPYIKQDVQPWMWKPISKKTEDNTSPHWKPMPYL